MYKLMHSVRAYKVMFAVLDHRYTKVTNSDISRMRRDAARSLPYLGPRYSYVPTFRGDPFRGFAPRGR